MSVFWSGRERDGYCRVISLWGIGVLDKEFSFLRGIAGLMVGCLVGSMVAS